MSILEFKKKYNSLLARAVKAEKFFETATDKEFDKWYPNYLEISRQLSGLMEEYKRLTGKQMTSEEVLNGFNR